MVSASTEHTGMQEDDEDFRDAIVWLCMSIVKALGYDWGDKMLIMLEVDLESADGERKRTYGETWRRE